ncbi:hypothetical protein SG18_25320 [Pandoraea apista]|nr:hypothetical protein SG18_25320 [Pandoraea apista]AKH71808.1 hypothetical protein XM39_05875 [Pandoraea apista]AKI64083.1 hypothetical protein AA956_23195 [Pandoraea apista]
MPHCWAVPTKAARKCITARGATSTTTIPPRSPHRPRRACRACRASERRVPSRRFRPPSPDNRGAPVLLA